MNERDIPILLTKIINHECKVARTGYGGTLVLGFGKVHSTKIIGRKKFLNCEWEIRTNSCAWRISKNGNSLCGSYDDEELCDSVIELLLSKKLISFDKENEFDFKLEFSDGYIVFLFGQALEDEHFSIATPKAKHITFSSKSRWSIEDDEFIEELSERDKLQSEHSEECHRRWQKFIHLATDENKCKICEYFIQLGGGFYFWDYGICSNNESSYDGKIVGVNSGCTEFRDL